MSQISVINSFYFLNLLVQLLKSLIIQIVLLLQSRLFCYLHIRSQSLRGKVVVQKELYYDKLD
jgi:hypothetical protein